MKHDEIRKAPLSKARRIARDLLIQNEGVTSQRDRALEEVERMRADRDRYRDELARREGDVS